MKFSDFKWQGTRFVTNSLNYPLIQSYGEIFCRNDIWYHHVETIDVDGHCVMSSGKSGTKENTINMVESFIKLGCIE